MSVLGDCTTISPTVDPLPSRFKFHDFHLLSDKSRSFLLPLGVICHIDLNAFFAQVEQIRLNLTKDDPVVCVQWQAVIAVSYAARKFGINRMDTIKTCKEKCPGVILAHAAVYEKGGSSWKYVDKLPYQGHCKVSLDPYRRESRKIFSILKANCDLIEKASVDEGFLDFGRIVYTKAIEYFPYLNDQMAHRDMPEIPKELPQDLQFKGFVYGDNNLVHDWNDILYLIASNVLFDIRRQIYQALGYTTSGGLGKNKIMAKLAGGFLKPDNQTIILHNQTQSFLDQFQLNDIGGMGGKIGDFLINEFNIPNNTNSIQYIRDNFSLQDLKTKPQVPDYLFDMVRGNYAQELRDRTDIKSMMSRKQLLTNAPCKTLYDAIDWYKVFAGDIVNRLQDLDEESSNTTLTRPKTLSVNVHINFNSYSKQCPLKVVKSLPELKTLLEKSSLQLLIDLLETHYDLTKLNEKLNLTEIHPFNKVNIPPISNLAITVTGLLKVSDSLDKFTDNKKEGIKKMFDKFNQESQQKQQQQEQLQEQKKNNQRLNKSYIDGLFEKFHQESESRPQSRPQSKSQSKSPEPPTKKRKPESKKPKKPQYDIVNNLRTSKCPKCNETFTNETEHEDFHMALELSKQ